MTDGLDCSHGPQTLRAADSDREGRQDAATSNVTDLRRARQKARAVIRSIQSAILDWMREKDVERLFEDASGVRRANREVTEIASERLRRELVDWLRERHRITTGRAARAAFDAMSNALRGEDMDRDDLRGKPEFDRRMDSETLRQIHQVDAGLLYDTELAEELGLNEPLAEELGDDITRQLRQGIANDETISGGLTDRVREVITEGDSDTRQEHGIRGHTKRTKAELIAHDSVEDAYNQAARGRYVRNGFRYAVFDATIDTKTSALCRRMDEVVVDMVDDPYLIPPLHPWCRSGIRPILDIGDREPISRDDIATGYRQTIMDTKSYRPPADAAGRFEPTDLTREQGQA